jgi:hypothetical protein
MVKMKLNSGFTGSFRNLYLKATEVKSLHMTSRFIKLNYILIDILILTNNGEEDEIPVQ